MSYCLSTAVASSVKWDDEASFDSFTRLKQASKPQLSHLLIADNNTILVHFTELLKPSKAFCGPWCRIHRGIMSRASPRGESSSLPTASWKPGLSQEV